MGTVSESMKETFELAAETSDRYTIIGFMIALCLVSIKIGSERRSFESKNTSKERK